MSRRVLFSFLIALAFGCSRSELLSSQEEQSSQDSTGDQATLAVEQSAVLSGLRVKLQQVNDSRCPKEATCIRYGSAIAEFKIEDTHGNSVTKHLYLGDPLPAPENRGSRTADTVEVALGNKHYLFILSDVQPYPSTSESIPAEKKVTVAVLSL